MSIACPYAWFDQFLLAVPPVQGEGTARPARERAGDVAVGGEGAPRPVHVVQAHVTDREAELVELPEHRRERLRPVAVHDELTRVLPSVEAPVGDGQQPQPRERNRAPRLPAALVDRASSGAAPAEVERTIRTTEARRARAAGRERVARLSVKGDASAPGSSSCGCEPIAVDETRLHQPGAVSRAVVLVEGISDQCAARSARRAPRPRPRRRGHLRRADRRRAVDRKVPEPVRPARTRRQAGGSLRRRQRRATSDAASSGPASAPTSRAPTWRHSASTSATRIWRTS